MDALPLTEAEAALSAAAIADNQEEVARLTVVVDREEREREARLTASGALMAAALWYAHHGLAVFPCWPGAKTPMTGHGFQEATTNVTQIRAWWSVHPRANIGLPTGWRYDVIDLDRPEALVVFYEKFIDANKLPPVRAIALTPRGRHLYIDADPRARNGTHIGGIRGADVRALGGYVIAPPSLTETGRYRWVTGHELRPERRA